MHKIKIIAAVVVFAVSLASTTAYADCAADIKTVYNEMVGLSTQHGVYQNIVDILDKAEKALAEGKKKRCAKLTKKAMAKLKEAL